MTGPLQRARLVPEKGTPLDFHYNPSAVTLTKAAHWQSNPARGHQKAPPPEFVGTDPRSVTIVALLDAFDDTKRDVSKVVDQLVEWTCASTDTHDQGKPQPNLLHMQWGDTNWFTGYLKQVEAKYSMFDGTGKPLRATVTLIIEEVPDEVKGQNPTSGGIQGRKSAALGSGETLAAVAYREYGDAALWRALAKANDIDDPARVSAGRRLLVPPIVQARRLCEVPRA